MIVEFEGHLRFVLGRAAASDFARNGRTHAIPARDAASVVDTFGTWDRGLADACGDARELSAR